VTKNNKIDMQRIPLYDSNGKKSGTMDLSEDIFTGKYNESLLYQALVMYRANQRKGTASTKTRGDVSGAGKKPWRQKGTGRARVGSIRNPVWRGGGIAFGPHPRDFRYSLPKKMLKSAFLSSLNAKLKNGKILGLTGLVLDNPKTKKISSLLSTMKIKTRVLLLVKNKDRNLILATRNIKRLSLKRSGEATALDVLSCDRVVITKEAADEFLSKKAKK